ncbi:Leucine-rich repeat-containing protein sog2 [Diplonema papillatum]|nr:Leucine-rich repeat-containing protein sog2 [Diplonema papillatum]KAJ9445737.1 Leucine-rich repeat-containing protein sog2 [Diplonema papillatum]
MGCGSSTQGEVAGNRGGKDAKSRHKADGMKSKVTEDPPVRKWSAEDPPPELAVTSPSETNKGEPDNTPPESSEKANNDSASSTNASPPPGLDESTTVTDITTVPSASESLFCAETPKQAAIQPPRRRSADDEEPGGTCLNGGNAGDFKRSSTTPLSADGQVRSPVKGPRASKAPSRVRQGSRQQGGRNSGPSQQLRFATPPHVRRKQSSLAPNHMLFTAQFSPNEPENTATYSPTLYDPKKKKSSVRSAFTGRPPNTRCDDIYGMELASPGIDDGACGFEDSVIDSSVCESCDEAPKRQLPTKADLTELHPAEIIDAAVTQRAPVVEIDDFGLTAIPDTLLRTSEWLAALVASHNQLTSIAPFISSFTLLQGLFLSNNQLTELPDCIGHLSILEQLDVSNNKLSTLPPSFSNLVNLQKLNLDYNCFTVFPVEALEIPKLQKLFVAENHHLSDLPPFELLDGTELQVCMAR